MYVKQIFFYYPKPQMQWVLYNGSTFVDASSSFTKGDHENWPGLNEINWITIIWLRLRNVSKLHCTGTGPLTVVDTFFYRSNCQMVICIHQTWPCHPPVLTSVVILKHYWHGYHYYSLSIKRREDKDITGESSLLYWLYAVLVLEVFCLRFHAKIRKTHHKGSPTIKNLCSFGHCPNSYWTPRPAPKRALCGTYFRAKSCKCPFVHGHFS